MSSTVLFTGASSGFRRIAAISIVTLTASALLAQEEEPQNSHPPIPSEPPRSSRTDLFISGIYPHLTTYGVYSQNGAHYKKGHNECGIGAVVPWAGKLWMVNYAPHMPKGSEHKLFSVDPDPRKRMTVHPESVGGTPAGRMILSKARFSTRTRVSTSNRSW